MHKIKRVLIVSEAPLVRTFVEPLIKKLKVEAGVVFDCLITTKLDEDSVVTLRKNFDQVFVNDCPKGLIQHIPKVRLFQAVAGLRRLAAKLENYDVIHIHYLHYYYVYFIPILKKKTGKLFISFYGSDFYTMNKIGHRLNKKAVKLADGIFATNQVFLDVVLKRYNVPLDGKQIGTLMFYMKSFDDFAPFLQSNTQESAKKMWDIKKGLIVCAYNAAPIMQHGSIVHSLNKLNGNLADYKILFPMTYGWCAVEMRAEVNEMLRSSTFDWQILDSYLPLEKLHALRLAADVFVVIPSSDQFSFSMLEHMAAGSVVIAGKWLPYRSLVESGIYFLLIEKPQDLAAALQEVLQNLDMHKKKAKMNREKILNLMSWDNIKGNWYHYYSVVEQPSSSSAAISLNQA